MPNYPDSIQDLEPLSGLYIRKRFLNEVLENDTEKIRYLQKIAGLSLTGNTEEEIIQ